MAPTAGLRAWELDRDEVDDEKHHAHATLVRMAPGADW